MITGKRMGKKVMAALLAAALVCGMTGCGKAESASGSAVTFRQYIPAPGFSPCFSRLNRKSVSQPLKIES